MKLWYHKPCHITALLIPFIMVIVLSSICVYADDDIVYNETDDIQVTLKDNGDETYSVIVSGNGAMKDYSRFSLPPWNAQYNTKISAIQIGSGITHVGAYSFNGATSLSSITFAEGLESIGQSAFQGCSAMTDVSIPKSVTSVANMAFSSANDLVVTVLGNNTVITQNSFSSGPGKTVKAFEDSLTVAKWQYTFGNKDNRTQLEILSSYRYRDEDEKTTTIEYLAAGTNVTVLDSIKTIGESTFANDLDLVSVNLNKATAIEDKAFENCSNLEKAIIPSTVGTISSNAFAGCENVVIYGNSGSVAEHFAEEYGFAFKLLKPYRSNGDSSFEKTLPTGAKDSVDLSTIFDTEYNTELHYRVKVGDGDYSDIDGSTYEFDATDAGEHVLTFCAVDSYGEQSDDVYVGKYSVVKNTAPVLNKDEIEVTTLFYERPEIDISDVFTDNEEDVLQYRYVVGDKDVDEINWDLFNPPVSTGDASILTVMNGSFTVPQSWTQYPRNVGKEQLYYVRAYDKWDVPSEDYLTIKVTVHSVCITVNKGQGVHSLEGISFKFSRDEADDIVQPAYIDENKYYFDLDYISNATGSYGGGYDYTYEVALDGCESVTGTYTTKNDNGEAMNGPHTIEVTLSNSEQAAKDEQSVADVKDLIDNLGEVTLDSEDAINAAQAAYNALFDDLKPQITNYNALLQARLTLADLKLEAAKKDLEEAEKAKEKADQDKKDAEAKIQTAENEVKQAKAELNGVKEELAAMKLTVKGLKVTSKKKKFTVKWKKNAKASGYTVQYKISGAKKFKTLKTLAKTKVVSKKLKKGKKYEFRVATYKKVNGKKVFGKWTEAKIVKCK